MQVVLLMNTNDVLKLIPVEGFLKIKSQKVETLSKEQKAVLIRKGNELFNSGEYEKAKKIFLTTGYTHGIIQMGEYYIKQKEPLEAFRMYNLAPAPDKAAEIVESMSLIIKKWLKEG